MIDPLAFAYPAAGAALAALVLAFARAPAGEERPWPGAMLAVLAAAALGVSWVWSSGGAVPPFPARDVADWPLWLMGIATILLAALGLWRPWPGHLLRPLIAAAGCFLIFRAVSPWSQEGLTAQLAWSGASGLAIGSAAAITGAVHARTPAWQAWAALGAWSGALAAACLLAGSAKGLGLALGAGAICGAIALVSLLIRRDRAGSHDETTPVVLGLGWVATAVFALVDRTPPAGAALIAVAAPVLSLLLLVPALRNRAPAAVVAGAALLACVGAAVAWGWLAAPPAPAGDGGPTY